MEQLFQDWRKPLLRYLVCSGLAEEESQDVVQDVFLRLHQHLLAGGSRENLRAWVFRVAHNAALNRRKSGAHRLSTPLLPHGDIIDRAACPRDGPERLLFRKERFRRLHAALRELDPIERACVLLRAEGMRYREIAAVLEIGLSTVADHLERALRQLGDQCNV